MNQATHIATAFVHKGWLDLIDDYQSMLSNGKRAPTGASVVSDQVDFRVIQKRYQTLLLRHGEKLLPVTIAQQVSALTFGSYSLALFTAPTAYTLLSIACEYSSILGIPLTLTFNDNQQDVVELNFDVNPISSFNTILSTSGQFLYALTLLALIKQATKEADIELELHLEKLPDEVTSNLAELERKLGCTLHLGAIKPKLSFKRKGLFHRLASSSPDIHAMALTLLNQQYGISHHNNLVLRMCRTLDELSDLSLATVDFIAQQLGMTKRTLNRRFSEMDTNYRAVIEKYKLDKSIALLANHKLSIAIISQQLGFTDATAFSRAFKRWTGSSPSLYRKS